MLCRFYLNIATVALLILFVSVYGIILLNGVTGAKSSFTGFYHAILIITIVVGALVSLGGLYLNIQARSVAWSCVHVIGALVFVGVTLSAILARQSAL